MPREKFGLEVLGDSLTKIFKFLGDNKLLLFESISK